ncbi:MAG: TadE/TadG family type IV pilus assembly protein [Pseudomonadota bacterium]
MGRLRSFLGRLRRDEEGVASFDFILIFPVYFMFLLASVEAGILMTRQVLLDRGVDMAVRQVRINTLNPPTYVQMRKMICEAAALIPDCENTLKLEMFIQDPRGTFNFKRNPDCIDRSLQNQPASIYTLGSQNQIMFVRACVKYDPVFPTSIVATAVIDGGGEYALVSTNIYVAEPNG